MSGFEPRGTMSRADACEEIILKLSPNEGIGKAEALEEMSARTGVAETIPALCNAMRSASERLMIHQAVPGLRNVRRYGWVRMTDEDLIQRYGRDRRNRMDAQAARMGRAARIADPELLSAEARTLRDIQLIIEVRLRELDDRRSQRQRPPAIEN